MNPDAREGSSGPVTAPSIAKNNPSMITSIFPCAIRSLTSRLFLGLLFLLVFLPTGSIFGLKVKVIALVAFAAVLSLHLITSPERLSFSCVIFLSLVGLFLLIWTLIGVLSGRAEVAQSFLQLGGIASTVFVPWVGIFLIRRGVVRAEELITTVIVSVFAISTLKLVLVAVSFLFGIDIIEATQSIFGEGVLLTGTIAFDLFRLNFTADSVSPFALFALLAPNLSGVRFGRISTLVALLVILVSGFIGFSRYIWFLFGIAILAAARVQRNWKLPVAIVLVGLAVSISFHELINLALESRFLSDATGISDTIRVEQSGPLVEEFAKSPILGTGMGAHAKVTTNYPLLYVYELQWLAFLMQFGIVGLIGILMLIAASAGDLFMARHPGKPWMWLLFLLWLLSGFVNPYLTTPCSGAAFALFMAIFYRMRNSTAGAYSRSVPLVPSPELT